jgi:hypothetical protein
MELERIRRFDKVGSEAILLDELLAVAGKVKGDKALAECDEADSYLCMIDMGFRIGEGCGTTG